jgi:hypothetical protein
MVTEAPFHFVYPLRGDMQLPGWPQGWDDSAFDMDRLVELIHWAAAKRQPDLVGRLEVGKHLYLADGAKKGWLNVTVSTADGDLLVAALVHWTAVVREGWTPPEPATVD